jgi:protein-tyrosine phosphatase
MRAVLFVCQGNLCRSPAGEAILLHLAQHLEIPLQVASCGVAVGEVGAPPDHRMKEAAHRRGIDLKNKTQPFQLNFFETYDLILASDKTTIHILQVYAPNDKSTAKIHLMTDFSEKYRGLDVPDPYLGDEEYFDCVLDMLSDACEGVLQEIKTR